jgi:cholera toxin transcriptional activator
LPDSLDLRVFRFGIFELDAHTGELRKDGKVRPRLQGQPLELALQLLARPGEVVTREDLRKRLWPADTFVDYDHSLNTAVNKLREALGDSADNPRFVQTLTRQGYRFIAPVQILPLSGDSGANASEAGGSAAAGEIARPAAPRVLSDPRELPPVPRTTARLLFGLLQVLYLAFYVSLLGNLQEVDRLLSETLRHPFSLWIFVLFVLTAVAGIPIRLYLLAAAVFGYGALSERFRRLFPVVFPLDEIWALAPFLMVDWIGTGLALAATAVLLFLPFSQRSILLMGDRGAQPASR